MMKGEPLSTASSAASSMKKWGIPHEESPEVSLLERLVWVRYKAHWWPALLYHSYSELQQYLYDQLDMVLKAQFAMAIMKQIQEKRQVKVARLLGRDILEVIEVEEDCYCEFYWQLPNVLPRACKKSHYSNAEDGIQLFFDFHRALDQVESIIREVSQENFALLPESDNQTWLERAHLAMKEDDHSSIPSSSRGGGGGGGRRRNNDQYNPTSVVSKGNSTIAIEKSAREQEATSVRSSNVVNSAPSGLSMKSRRSTKTQVSQAVTEVMDNRTPYQQQQQESREPSSSSNTTSTFDHRTSSIGGAKPRRPQQGKRSFSPFDATFSAFNNVFGIISSEGTNGAGVPTQPTAVAAAAAAAADERDDVSEEEELSVMQQQQQQQQQRQQGKFSYRHHHGPETMPVVTNKAMRSAVTPDHDEDDSIIFEEQQQQRRSRSSPANPDNLSFWQRLACYTADF